MSADSETPAAAAAPPPAAAAANGGISLQQLLLYPTSGTVGGLLAEMNEWRLQAAQDQKRIYMPHASGAMVLVDPPAGWKPSKPLDIETLRRRAPSPDAVRGDDSGSDSSDSELEEDEDTE